MRLRDILNHKGFEIHTIRPTASLQDVVDQLVDRNCGSLLVVENGHLYGIITERDILRAMAVIAGPLALHRVSDHMSRDLVTARTDDELNEVMGQMTMHRVRHLPVLEEEQLVGIVSIGDVVKAQHDELSIENEYLKNYIQG